MIIPLPGDTYTVPVSTVDNYHAGGIAANVDIETGVLGAGTRGAWGVVTDHHPACQERAAG